MFVPRRASENPQIHDFWQSLSLQGGRWCRVGILIRMSNSVALRNDVEQKSQSNLFQLDVHINMTTFYRPSFLATLFPDLPDANSHINTIPDHCSNLL